MSTWVLLRGLGGERGHWGAFPEVLRPHLPPGDAVACVDLPGNGAHWRERSPVRVQAMVDVECAQPRSAGGLAGRQQVQQHGRVQPATEAH